MTVLLIIGLIVVIIWQMLYFFKKKQYKEAVVCFILMSFATVYAISGLTDWDFPAPDKLAETIFNPLSDFIFNASQRK